MTSAPANWYYREGAPRSGRMAIFDLDGVISNASGRQHFLRGGRWDLRGFFMAADRDPPIPWGLGLAASVVDDCAVAILTARPDYVTGITRSWIAEHQVRHDLLILRSGSGRGSQGTAADFKRYELARLRAAGYEIVLAVDDAQQNVDMYRSEGVFAFYVESGYY